MGREGTEQLGISGAVGGKDTPNPRIEYIHYERANSGQPSPAVILSIHVAPSISHLIERNARHRQLHSVGRV